MGDHLLPRSLQASPSSSSRLGGVHGVSSPSASGVTASSASPRTEGGGASFIRSSVCLGVSLWSSRSSRDVIGTPGSPARCQTVGSGCGGLCRCTRHAAVRPPVPLVNPEGAADWHAGCEDALTFDPMPGYVHKQWTSAYRDAH